MNIKDFKSVLIVSVAIVLGVFVAPTKAANISRVVNFEDLTLGPEEFYNGSDGAGGFTSQDAFFGVGKWKDELSNLLIGWVGPNGICR
ncbi:MAG: hypothetical protein F6K25_30205 [Okeania sp. SIO2G4]|uniref:hypothetical protein n=1 Tax=unclassified Okeania TaxID=2634635 RepID=UPI0013B6B0D8|nr:MULTISPECIES: hypothetical protein [unclassified Okeania]NEP08475.1 hypothetical protein [Okeania sp. SIO4D6]NEP46478.1 hypothetical protein [Okeania sp. SIO2H7]NEP75852.1 hypothetical protein [Okeania sp. SIO2G5]NEP96557.1 hypothetical protein [Okeania sp. SIO2F5]NEQ94678.1 hypothetical protein [Okeania sp. SIO2G4]